MKYIKNNLSQRIYSGIVGGTFILLSIYLSIWSFFIAFFIIHWFSLREFYRLHPYLKNSNPYLLVFSITTGLFIHILSFLIENQMIKGKYYFIVFTLFLIFYVIKLYRKELNPFDKVGICFLGILYVSVPFALFNIIALHKGVYNPNLICGIFLLVCLQIQGLTLQCKFLGKTKLFRVSHLIKHGKEP